MVTEQFPIHAQVADRDALGRNPIELHDVILDVI
jgi:hypothetical protein